jgi:acetate kinase
MSILAINAGSSSLKFGLFDNKDCARLVAGQIDWASGDRQEAQLTVWSSAAGTVRSRLAVPDSSMAATCAIQAVLGALGPHQKSPNITAVGHRVVHGGSEFRDSVLVDERVKVAIAKLSDLAPLHNPPALKGIESAEAVLGGRPQVAVFDTAFYAQLPPKEYIYAVPYVWYRDLGVRRFGFHGISHAYCVNRAAELMKRDPMQLRIISCHLGGGCSATAVRGGVAVATSSGFSPLDGLMMGTRCGAVDPGILLHLQRQLGMTVKDLSRHLNHSSGLLGVSGVSADLAEIEVAARQGNERARLALDIFSGQVRNAIGSLATRLGGVDAVTFTDRIGVGSAALRAAVCSGLEFMGIKLDLQRNASAEPDTDIAPAGSNVRVFVIQTKEELMVARETLRVVRSMGSVG